METELSVKSKWTIKCGDGMNCKNLNEQINAETDLIVKSKLTTKCGDGFNCPINVERYQLWYHCRV